MSYIESFIPGQISLPNYIDVPVTPPPPEGTVKWNDVVGQYAKIEGYQYNYALATNHAHMPNPYNPNLAGHANTIFGELDRKRWLRGILLELDWGRIETAAGVRNWDFVDFVFNTIRGLPKSTGKDKRVLLLINLRHVASLNSPARFPASGFTHSTCCERRILS